MMARLWWVLLLTLFLLGPAGVAAADVQQLFAQKQSHVWTEFSGRVERLLADDNKGSRHQRFIVRTAPGVTVLVSHNIDLAPRAPLRVGDSVSMRGEYIWNRQGGILHWTHHDPKNRHAGGWIDTPQGRVR